MTVTDLVANVELVDVDTLHLHPDNPRRGDLDAIRESLERNGWYGVLVAQTSTRRIIVGNHRYQAAVTLGYRQLPVAWLDVDDTQAARIMLADNRTGERATYDPPALTALLERFRNDPPGTAWRPGEIDRYIARYNPVTIDDETPTPPPNPITQPGDIWTLGRHRLICGDVTDPTCYPNHPARFVVADPPYGVNYTGGSTNDTERADGFDDQWPDLETALRNAHQHTDRHAALHLWYAERYTERVCAAVTNTGWARRAILIWHKTKPHFGALGAQYKFAYEPFLYAHKPQHPPRWYGPTNETTVWSHDQPRRNDHHPTQKPVTLIERAIRNHTEPDDLILDLYSGSGTTLIAAETTGRAAHAIEASPAYCDVIITRWEHLTGQTATRTP